MSWTEADFAAGTGNYSSKTGSGASQHVEYDLAQFNLGNGGSGWSVAVSFVPDANTGTRTILNFNSVVR